MSIPVYDPQAAYNERIDRELREFFGTEVRRLESAAEAFRRDKQALYRSDGQPKYGPQEHTDRMAALLATLDEVLAWVKERADEGIADGQRQLAALQGADLWDRLSESERAAANTRSVFVREDVEALPYSRLAELARAAVAANDKPSMYLWWRYGTRRLAPPTARLNAEGLPATRAEPSSPDRLAFLETLREIEGKLGDPKADEKRQKAARKVEIGKVLMGRASSTRLDLDGTSAAALETFRREMVARW